jgi:DNA-binding NtrC family response regulator
MKQVLIAQTADFDLPTAGIIKNINYKASSKNEEITKALTEQAFDHLFIDEEFDRAISLCRKSAARYPKTEITIMLNRNHSNLIKSFIQAGASNYFFKSWDDSSPEEQIYASVQKNHSSDKLENGRDKTHKGLIIADASVVMDIQLRIELTNKGYRLYEASNITETVYFIKNKNIREILIDKSVLDKNSGFLKSLISFLGNQGLRLLILAEEKPEQTNYRTQNTQIEYINNSKTNENIYKQILKILN